jgi:septation ring formation regulator EzrA
MHQNNNNRSTPSIERLLSRIISAERTNQKEIRLTIQEAREITNDLSLLTARLGVVIEEINTNLAKISENSNKIELRLDGGGFEQR